MDLDGYANLAERQEAYRKRAAVKRKANEGQRMDIENNFTYHPPKEGQITKYNLIRECGKNLASTLDGICPDSREKSIAITKLEEAVMWANAAIARNEP